MIGSTVLEIVLGAVISIVITVIVERTKKPSLYLSVGKPYDANSEQIRTLNKDAGNIVPFGKRHRHLYVYVGNRSVNRLFRWCFYRETAIQCRAEITFHYMDGRRVFEHPMPARWAGSANPSLPVIHFDKREGYIVDPARLSFESRMDIRPGTEEGLDTVVRFDVDDACFGWNNESTFQGLRHPQWRLPDDRYLMKVTVISSGDRVSGIFCLFNNPNLDSFRIELATDDERKRVR